MKKVLVIQLAKLGDFLQTRCFMESMSALETVELYLLIDKKLALLLPKYFPPMGVTVLTVDVGKLVKISQEVPWSLAVKNLVKELEPLLNLHFDEVYNLNTIPLVSIISQLIKTKKRLGSYLNSDLKTWKAYPAQKLIAALWSERRYNAINLVDVWKTLLPTFKSPISSDLPREEHREQNLYLKEPGKITLGLQVGANHHSRIWSPERFVAFAQSVYEMSLKYQPLGRILLLGAPGADTYLAQQFLSVCEPGLKKIVLNLTGRTTLSEYASVLQNLDLFVSSDTGAMHLAAALKVKSLALFMGPAWAQETAPYHEGVFIYQALAPCSPCQEVDQCPQEKQICAAQPQAAPVAQLAASMLGWGSEKPPSWGPDRYIFKTAFDNFGLYLQPWGSRPEINQDSLIALAIRETSRFILQPQYETNWRNFNLELESYDFAEQRLAKVKEEILNITSGNKIAAKFTEAVNRALMILEPILSIHAKRFEVEYKLRQVFNYVAL